MCDEEASCMLCLMHVMVDSTVNWYVRMRDEEASCMLCLMCVMVDPPVKTSM